MKKIYTIIIMFLALLKVQGQDYFISFAGSGAATTIGTVKVDNLTSGATVTLNGSDILHLIPSLGIGDISAGNRYLHLYPNPMEERTTLEVVTLAAGTSTISLINLTGQTVCQVSRELTPGVYRFRVSVIQQGLYLVKVTGNGFCYSTKLVSRCKLPGGTKIEFVTSMTGSESSHLKSTAATIDMQYTDGNTLIFKGTSGDYSAIVTDVPTGSKTISFPFITCTDSDGNNYATVQIGSGKFAQTWMAENLKVGTGIDITQLPADNGIVEYYCYNDDVNLCGVYGGLYRWDEMMNYNSTEGSRGICPNGWHIPTNQEFYDLENFLGGMNVAGGKLKETGLAHWNANNVGATNETGFTALPGGYRDSWGLIYALLGIRAAFWSSSPGTVGGYYFYMAINNFEERIYMSDDQLESAYSVRCIYD